MSADAKRRGDWAKFFEDQGMQTIRCAGPEVTSCALELSTRCPLPERSRREAEQTERLRALAAALEQRRAQVQALNVAGISLTSELDTATVLQRVVDQARLVAAAKYAALGVFDEDGNVSQFITSG